MNQPGILRQQLPLWGLIVGLWCLLVVAFAGQLVFTGNLEWTEAFRLSLRDWYPWAFLAPVVAWLSFQFPFRRDSLFLSIPVHVAACMGALLVCELLARPLPSPQRPWPQEPGMRMAPDGTLRERREDRWRPGDRLQPLRDPERPVLPGEEMRRPVEPGFQGGPPASAGPRFGPPAQVRQGLFLEALAMRAKFNIPIYWTIVCIVQAFVWYRRSQEKERAELALQARLAEARLDALRMQLHPHFLFNTLNAISALVHKDPHAADEMIVNLGELLRATLDTREQQIPLAQELRLLDRYLEIQEVRFGDRLKVSRTIDTMALEGLVPTLILQPLVENSIRHGIEPRTGAGSLEIKAERVGDSLRLVVRDDGPGATAGAKQKPAGIGLANTRARLQEMFGTEGRLSITTSMGPGFTAEILIPFRTMPTAANT